MKVIRAQHLGMCFGVRDAVTLALERADAGPLTILGDLVHNDSVLARLRGKGIVIERHAARVKTPTVMVTAHGASARTLARTRALGLNVLEATCPLVQVAHRAVASLVELGYHPIIIGRRDHVEVLGLTEDLDEVDVVLTEEDVWQLEEHPRFGVAVQTTQPIGHARYLVSVLRDRFPRSEIRFVDTVCLPTKQRQDAATALARQCDVVIVIGGAESNNTRELVHTCRGHCSRVHHVQTALDLCAEWFVAAHVVGITAGTSTPDEVIESVDRRVRELSAGSDENER